MRDNKTYLIWKLEVPNVVDSQMVTVGSLQKKKNFSIDFNVRTSDFSAKINVCTARLHVSDSCRQCGLSCF